MTPCPLGCRPMSRPERRRMERDVKATKRCPGAGKGWALTGRRRRYRVVERRVDYDRLLAESEAVARRLGCVCLG